ncbi:MAG: hypothetical protein QXK37_06190, partial [Candidatus Woesearchaeota archaeon]
VCYDNASNEDWDDNRTVTIDHIVWDISSKAPQNYTNFTTTLPLTVNFTWYTNDNYPTDEITCNLSINGAVNKTGLSANINANTTTSVSFTNAGFYNWSVACINEDENEIKTTETWWFNLSGNLPPQVQQVNITPTTAYKNSSLNCSALPIDNASSSITVNFTWFVNNVTNISTQVPCVNNTWCYADIAPTGFLKHYNITCSARAFDGSLYSDWVNSTTIEIQNYAPSNVSLLLPAHGNDTILTRTPEFNWTNTTDPENDTLLFSIWIQRMTCAGPLSCTIDNLTANTTFLNYTPSVDLDTDSWYNWSVRVWDGENWSEWSETWNFSILSTSIILINNTVNFSAMQINEEDNTTDNDPSPFLIENNGNVHVNITVYALEPLWVSALAPLGTHYFQFKADNSSESDSFEWNTSQTSWAYINGTTYASASHAVSRLNYTANDTAEIDILIIVPPDEPPGNKSAVVVFEAEYSG